MTTLLAYPKGKWISDYPEGINLHPHLVEKLPHIQLGFSTSEAAAFSRGTSCALLEGWFVIEVFVEHRGGLPAVS